MVTCLGDMLFPDVGLSTVTLLRRLGLAVEAPRGQTCCGMPLFNSGYHRDAAAVANRTIDLFRGAEYVVVPSGSCAYMVKHEYPHLARTDEGRRAAQDLASRTWELSQFLVRVLGVSEFASSVRGRVTYHDSCHLLRGLGEAEAPRTILRRLKGVELVELAGSDECCGFGGSFSVRLPEVSSGILERKVAAVEAAGASCVVACDSGCLMQIGGGLRRRGSAVRAVHLAELLGGDAA